MSSEDIASVCGSCGASVYREHLDSGIARYEDGKLLCSHCLAEFDKSHDSAVGGSSILDFEPIELEGGDDDTPMDMSQSQIQAVGKATLGQEHMWDDSKYKRPIDPMAIGASRCRVFHTKLSQGALDFMNNQVNEWLDGNTDIAIKFAMTTVGPFEGKHTEPNLILTVFY